MRLQEGKKPSERSESVIAAIRQPGLYVEGRVGQRACSIRIDTGADRTVVDANLVEETEYLGGNVTLEGFNGFNASQPLAKVWIEVGKHRLHHIVAVVDNAPEKILLGMDTGIMRYLLELEVQQMQAKEELKLANTDPHSLMHLGTLHDVAPPPPPLFICPSCTSSYLIFVLVTASYLGSFWYYVLFKNG